MAILSSSMQTFVDLTDQRKLSCYLTANLPTTQIQNPNTDEYNPDWVSTSLEITPVVYIDNDRIVEGVEPGLSIEWTRRLGSGNVEALSVNEVKQANGNLRISNNVLSGVTSGLISYICNVNYNDPQSLSLISMTSELSFSLIRNAMNARTLSVSGEQAFKYSNTGTITGTSVITLVATMQGVSFGKWQYKNANGTFVDYPTTSDNVSITSYQLKVAATHAVFFNNVCTVKAISNDPNVYDIFSIIKLYDGADGEGQGGLSVIVGNEAQQIVCENNGTAAGPQTINIPFKGYSGITQVPMTLTVGTLPTGMTVYSNKASTQSDDGLLVLKVADGSNLGGVTSGEVPLTFTFTNQNDQIASRLFTWSKAIKGDSGVNSVILTLVTPNGNMFDNGLVNTADGSLTIQSYAYDGITTITSDATYSWAKYNTGNWTTISGQTGNSLKVTADDVLNITSFRCTMTYKTKTYNAVVTLMDKTDPYVSEMVAINGTTFKNGIGGSPVYIVVRRGTSEVDALKGPIKTSAPISPVTGDYWWEVNEETKVCTLKKYSGSAWVAVTAAADKQTLKYNWYKRNKNGEDDDSYDREGKVVYLSASDVDSIATLQCNVEE